MPTPVRSVLGRVLLAVFAVVAVVHLVALLAGWRSVAVVTKPPLMLLLAGYVAAAVGFRRGGVPLVVGLVFAAGGDTALLFSGTAGFAAGIGLFLVTQVCFLVAWLRLGAGAAVRRRWWLPVVYGVVWAGTTAGFAVSGRLALPVLIGLAGYGLVEFAQAALAAARSVVVGVGAALFTVSDTLIALGAAHVTLPGRGFLVMLPYLTGMALIAFGAVRLISRPGGGGHTAGHG